MTTMDQIHRIRELYYEQGKNLKDTAAELGLDWRTVRKYVDKEDFNLPKPVKKKQGGSKLDPYKAEIDGWLKTDLKAPRKQRHTAKRIHHRLKQSHREYSCSYRLVDTYVSQKKKELRLGRKQSYLPLIHAAGEAQADFGSAVFYENGKKHEGKYLVLSFPHSNGGFFQLNYGENMECLLEGLETMFEHAGGVPTEIWFDNTSTIVTKIIRGEGRTVTERFQRFSEHYRFKPVFMNPESGWEKGNVENKVGYLRHNLLVPVPEFMHLEKFNTELLEQCDRDMQREHYEETDRTIAEIFLEDAAALLPLPSVPFETSGYLQVMTDKYGKFTLNKQKHIYSASPEVCEEPVGVRLTSREVIVLDRHMNEIVRHRRLYGDEPAESMDWVPYLRYIARKPRSLKNTGIYGMMPQSMQMYMDSCESSERGRVLKLLAELTERTGFESAVNTIDQAISHNATDPDSLLSLYNRTYADVPQLPPLESSEDIPSQNVIPIRNDLAEMDAILRKGGARSHG